MTRATVKAMLIMLGLSDAAATEISAEQGQNLSHVQDYAELGEDEIKMLFSSLKHPGGLTSTGNRYYGQCQHDKPEQDATRKTNSSPSPLPYSCHMEHGQ